MRSHQLNADVVVMGGGPAGSTTATMLARQGARVVLLERERFPREHVGESLLPASIPILEELGVMPEVERAGFLLKWGATMVWGRDRTPWSWYFKETNQRYPHSYQVWRPRFDQILLENSRANGVDAREGHQVVDVVFEGDKVTGVSFIDDNGGHGSVSASLVVDASGQNGLLGRRLDLRQWDSFFQNLAVYAYFRGGERLPQPDETNIFIESYPHGWLWTIPLHTGLSSVGAVVDSAASQAEISRLGPEEFLKCHLAQAPDTSRMLRSAQMESGPFVIKDWSYVCRELVGPGYILAGDAACFVDPLFSSGVHLAMMSGVLASAYATSTLKDPDIAQAAGAVYQELYLKEYQQFREMARLFYSSNLTSDSYFWEARRLVEGAADFSPRHAFIRAVAGQPPRGYERAVLDKGEAPADFTAGVRAVELERSQRRARIATFQTPEGLMHPVFFGAVPRLAQGVSVERKPVLGEGEFQWGYVIISPHQPEGAPCSGLVAEIVSQMDGATTVASLVSNLQKGRDSAQFPIIEQTVIAALQVLYVDGTIAELGSG